MFQIQPAKLHVLLEFNSSDIQTRLVNLFGRRRHMLSTKNGLNPVTISNGNFSTHALNTQVTCSELPHKKSRRNVMRDHWETDTNKTGNDAQLPTAKTIAHAPQSTGQPCHPSMKPVMRSTELRRWLSSRARPGPDRSANAAAPSDRRRDTSTCGGTMVPLRPTSSSSSLQRAAERAAGLGMSTGREPARRGASGSGTPRRAAGVLDRGASAADDELQPGGASPPSSWAASGHRTSDSHSSSAIAIAAVDRFAARLIGSRCALRGRSGNGNGSFGLAIRLGLWWTKGWAGVGLGRGEGAYI